MPIPAIPGLPILLALPSLHISTAEAYEHLSAQDRVVPAMLELDGLRRPDTLAKLAVNDFEASVFARHPELGVLRAALQEAGALTARLSGSGAAVFGLFNDRAAADRARVLLSPSWGDVRFVVTETMALQPRPNSSSSSVTP